MSMILAIKTLGEENRHKAMQDAVFIWRILAPEAPELYVEAAQSRKQGGLSKLFGRKPGNPELVAPDINLAAQEGEEIDLDKSWHGLHYLLTQTAWEGAWPYNFLLAGGSEAGDVDVGYGPARLLSADETKQVQQMLAGMDAAWLQRRFDPQRMMQLEIYPEIWDRDPADDDTVGYCLEYFESLRDFVAEAARNNLGLVIYLS